jgi:ankyrin repeat protein
MYFGNGTIDIATPSFAQVIRNMQQRKWIYFFMEDLNAGTIAMEVWGCHDMQILISKEHNRGMGLFDFTSKKQYSYYPQQNTIEITHLRDDFPLMYKRMLSSLLHLLDEIVEGHVKADAHITTQKATYNGIPALVYRFEVGLSDDRSEISNWVVDEQTHLPIICEISQVRSDGTVQRSSRIAFDYPEIGPQDIYYLGAPSDAEVIDKTPDEATLRILETYYQQREKTPPSYAAIIRQSERPQYLEYKDGPLKRVEHYELAINGSDYTPKKDFHVKQMGDTFDSLYEWLANTDIMRCTGIRLHDGVFYYNSYPMRDRHPRRYQDHGLSTQLANLGWPGMDFEGKVVEDNYSQKNGLICIKREHGKRYIDPNRGYMCVMQEYTVKGKKVQKIVEPAQTASGFWYPRAIGISGDFTNTVFIDDDPDFPEGIFSPNSLPNYQAWKGETEQQELVLRKASLDTNEPPIYEGFTPLHMAVFTGNLDSVKQRLTQGADPNPKFNTGATPMELAAAAGRFDMVKLLFEHGAGFTDPNGRCALATAAQGGNLDVLAFMLDNGADVNGRYKNGRTALHFAAEQARTEFVKLLLEYGADVEIRGGRYDQHTALFATVEKSIYNDLDDQFIETAKLLLEAGANVDTRGFGPHTPLMWFYRQLQTNPSPNFGLIKLLIEYGADVNINIEGYRNPMVYAVEAKNLEALRILLENGADPFMEEDTPMPPPLPVFTVSGKDSKQIEQLLYKFMEPTLAKLNPAIEAATRKFLDAVEKGDGSKGLQQVDIEGGSRDPKYVKIDIEKLGQEYIGEYDLLDEILKIRYQGGFSEVYLRWPGSEQNRYLVIELMQYPNESWKVVHWQKKKYQSIERLEHVPARSARHDCQEYRDKLFEDTK